MKNSKFLVMDHCLRCLRIDNFDLFLSEKSGKNVAQHKNLITVLTKNYHQTYC